MRRMDCPCGTHLTGADDDELVSLATQHLAEQHPELADVYSREHILFLAY